MNKKDLQKAENRLWSKLHKTDTADPLYDQLLNDLQIINELGKRTSLLNNPQIVSVVGYLAGILIILAYERTNVITTKAFGFIPRINGKG